MIGGAGPRSPANRLGPYLLLTVSNTATNVHIQQPPVVTKTTLTSCSPDSQPQLPLWHPAWQRIFLGLPPWLSGQPPRLAYLSSNLNILHTVVARTPPMSISCKPLSFSLDHSASSCTHWLSASTTFRPSHNLNTLHSSIIPCIPSFSGYSNLIRSGFSKIPLALPRTF